MQKVCWSCGHWLIGLGCTKEGFNENVIVTEHDDMCEKWCPEGTKGTATDFEEINDGTTWADNEYLKDDESNL